MFFFLIVDFTSDKKPSNTVTLILTFIIQLIFRFNKQIKILVADRLWSQSKSLNYFYIEFHKEIIIYI